MKMETKTVVSPSDDAVVNAEDLAYILGENARRTWDEFYDMLEMERASGNNKCPMASYIALELLTPTLMKMPWRSARTNSETHQDMIHEAYFVIMDHIDGFDRSKSEFKTYISKWLQGLVREIRDDGVSVYQQNQGIKIVSVDAIASKSTIEGSSESSVEFIDEHSSIEDILDRKDKVRSRELFRQAVCNGCDIEKEVDRKKVYTNAACYSLFCGGISALSDDMKELLEEVLAER